MALDQKQFERFKILHRHLSKGERLKWSEIKEIYLQTLGIEVSRKTVFNDINNLKDIFSAPIESDKGSYYYTSGFSLFGALNPDDVQLAQEIRTLFSQYSSLPHIKGLEEVGIKIEERLKISATRESIVHFEQNEEYFGLKHLSYLYDAIKNKKPVKITYRDFEGAITIHSLSPYLLKEFNNRWHVYGYAHIENAIYNFALDRILKIEDSNLPFRQQKEDDLSFLKHVIGFTRLFDNQTKKHAQKALIKIRFENKRANYVETKPLHHSQIELVEKRTETSKTFEINVIPNNELIAKILEFGADAEVLEPLTLRKQIREIVKKMMDRYLE